jgi:hypothetical protein
MAPEAVGQWNVGSIATAGNKHPAIADIVVTWIKNSPFASEVNFHPCCEIHWWIRGVLTDIADVSRAVSRDPRWTFVLAAANVLSPPKSVLRSSLKEQPPYGLN